VPTIDELLPFVTEPREDLAAEYKGWLNLTDTNHKAVLVKAAIAIANHGGGYIIIGMRDERAQLVSLSRPDEIPAITQDAVNAVIKRFSTPEFHCEVYVVPHPETSVLHPVIVVPGGMTEPVMSKRDCQNVIAQNRVYIRKPGPRSEEPQTGEEWRALLRRCVQNGREDMLDSIRAIVSGRVDPMAQVPDVATELRSFAAGGRERWQELVADLPDDDTARFPHGYYEMTFKLVGAEPAPTLVELRNRLQVAQRIRLTGWTTFLDMNRPEWAPYLHEEFIEAWVGRKVDKDLLRTPAHCDFWRASRDGKLYTIRGYSEDGIPDRLQAGAAINLTTPVWRVGEGVLFASRFAEAFEGVESIAIECTFTGLKDRYLTSIDGMRAMFDDLHSRTDTVTLVGQPTVLQVRDNLAEVMQALLSPLYERFDFFVAPFELFDTELNKLRSGRF
jgi:Putative DNA-binding domain